MSNAPPRRATPVSDRGVARGRPQRAGPPVPTALSELLGQLEATSVGAELQAVDARDVERDTLALLGQTARALHALVWPVRDAGAAELWEVRRRVTRMRAWLRARTEGATPALPIALCEQTLHALTDALRDDQRAAGRRPNDTAEFEVEFGAELGAERT